MTLKDYQAFAEMIGNALAEATIAEEQGTDQTMREFVYANVYRPLSDLLYADNPRFDRSRFSYACAVAEGKRLNTYQDSRNA